jgi:hypothetical protein
MTIEFHDKNGPDEHERFQQWRRENHSGFFINCKSPNNMMIHTVSCSHSGDTEWGRDGEWGSLTKNRKICSTNPEELRVWAGKNSGAALKKCRDCM